MKYDDNTALLFKMEIDRLIQFYNIASTSQQIVIKKQLKIIKRKLKINQIYLQKQCGLKGHSYSDWVQISSLDKLGKNHHKFMRTCRLCGYCDINKENINSILHDKIKVNKKI